MSTQEHRSGQGREGGAACRGATGVRQVHGRVSAEQLVSGCESTPLGACTIGIIGLAMNLDCESP